MSGTLVLPLALLVGLSGSFKYTSGQWTTDTQVDAPQEPAKPFQSGYQYIYTYKGQISSGLGNTRSQQKWDENQKAVSRIEAQAKITFLNAKSAILRLEKIHMGQANRPIKNEKEVQPMGMFERKKMPQDKRQQLELAVHFEYLDGLVAGINFLPQDPIWARNIKRSVLNLLQVSLNQQRGQQWDEQQQDGSRNGESVLGKSFTVSETTIEGNCETTYTVNPNSKPGRQEEEQFNVTKTINFQRCHVAFGHQTQQPAECASCQQPATYKNQQRRQQPWIQCQEYDSTQIKHQEQLSRSTMIRFVLQGGQQNYAIQRAELVSQYIYNNMDTDVNYPSGLQTVVAAQLIFQKRQFNNDLEHNIPQSNKANSLVFDSQPNVEEKRFYQLGDESSRTSPFAEHPKRVEQAEQIIRRLVHAASDKQKGIEFHQLAKLQRLVEIFRMCSMEELEQIMSESPTSSKYSGIETQEKKQQQQLVANCLAMAGTRNTIQVLADKITNEDLSPYQALQAVKALQELPAFSDEQVEIVQLLCQHRTVDRTTALKQTCWLTFGSMVSQLCQKGGGHVSGAETAFQPKQDMCCTDKKRKYKQALEQQYEQAQSTYEKVLALKAIGNAGLGICVPSLQAIIVDDKQEPIVRTVAIDALRRLRTQIPHEIQHVLLPTFQNTMEHPQMRMAAFGMIMQTRPQQPVLDQIGYTLTQESQPEVLSLVYSLIKTLSKSKAAEDQKIAKNLNNCLNLANVDDRCLRRSRKYQVPIYSPEQKQGVTLNFWSAYRNSRSLLPSYSSAGVEAFLNSIHQKDTLKISTSQQNIEKWYESLLEKLFATTKTRTMQRSQQEGRKQEDPFAMICIRVRDLDQVILPVDKETIPQCLRPELNRDCPSLSEWMPKFENTQHFHLFSNMNFKETTARIPTSMGVTLSFVETMPMIASIEGGVTAETRQAESSIARKIQLNLHTTIAVAYTQKMESWLPIFSTGVESTQAIEFNLPILAEIRNNAQNGVNFTIKVPQVPKTQLVGVHNLPSTYTREWDENNKMMKDPKMKTIYYPQFEHCQQEVQNETRHFNFLLHHKSFWHWPCKKLSGDLLELILGTENHLQMTTDGSTRNTDFQINSNSQELKKLSSWWCQASCYSAFATCMAAAVGLTEGAAAPLAYGACTTILNGCLNNICRK